MEFHKFPSMEDWTNKKARQGFLKVLSAPENKDVHLVVQEKVDGANIQLLFQPGQPMRVGRRNAWLQEGDNFFDIWTTLDSYKDSLDRIQAHVDSTNVTWRLYGELYGPKVQRRIPYCEGQSDKPTAQSRICLFDLRINDAPFVTPADLADHLREAGVHDLMVPPLYLLNPYALEDHMLYHATNPYYSKIACQQVAEGVIIRPYNKNCDTLVNGVMQRKMLKYRNPQFREMSNARIPKPDMTPLQQSFQQYVNANRACSVVSKLGPPTKATIGKVYIPELKRDALEDFCKDHPSVSSEDVEKLKRTKLPGVYALFQDHIVEKNH